MFIKNRIIKNIFHLAYSQYVSQVVRFVAFLFIARELSSENYGNYIIVLAFVDFFTFLTFPGINKPITREGARNLENLKEILESKIGIRNFFLIFAFLSCNIFLLFTDYPLEVKKLIFILSFSIIIQGVVVFLRIIFNVNEAFNFISFDLLLQSIFFSFISIIFILFGYSYDYLVYILLSSYLLSLFYNLYFSKRFVTVKFFSSIVFDSVFIKSSIFFTLINALALITAKIDVLMISLLDKSDEAGFYSIANRIVGIGIIVISAVMKSSYPRLLKTMKEKTFTFIDLGYYPLIYFLLIFLGSAALYITFDLVILDFIGNEYSPSLAVLRILIFYVLIQSFISPLLLFLQAHDLEQKIFYCTFPLPFIKIILNLYFFPTYGTIGLAYSTLILYTFFFFFLITINFNLFRKYF